MSDQSTGDTELVEALAALEHRQWRHWTQSLAEREDLPDHLVERWEENWVPYDELDDETKEHDRVWAEAVVELLNEHEIVAEAGGQSTNGTERLDEKPRHVLRELSGVLSDYQLDREPPVSMEEAGEIEGAEFAVDEIKYIIENGDVRPSNADGGQSEDGDQL